MKWENLTAQEFKDAKEVTKGVALIPYGCLEKHGYHLPLGTDIFIGRDIAEKAAEREPALVVPTAPYGIISEARHCEGTLSISSKLQYEILEEVCDELARNGYNKIILLDAHGGGKNFLRYFCQSRLEKRHPYAVFVYECHYRTQQLDDDFEKLHGKMRGGGHADAKESSEIAYLYPELTHLDRIDPSDEQTQEQGRLNDTLINGLFTAIGWYADHPYHIAGDPTGANAEKGKMLNEYYVARLAEVIKAVKEDTKTLELLNEFYTKAEGNMID